MSTKSLHDEIARVAHDLYEKRGRVHGSDLEDWLEAERIVRNVREVEQEVDAVKSRTGKKTSGKDESQGLMTSEKPSKSSSQPRTRKSRPKKKI